MGDGYGAVLYRPPAADAAADAGTFHYTHQDDLTEIQTLKNRDGSSKNYSQTLLWFLATEGLSYYTSSGDVVGVDHSGKTPQIYELNVEPERTKLRFSLYLEWSQFE